MPTAYEKHITKLISKTLGRRKKGVHRDIRPLLHELGCWGRNPVGTPVMMPAAEDEGVIRSALFQALGSFRAMGGSFGDVALILEGYTKNDRWHGLLHSREDAFSLAMLIVSFTVIRDVAENKQITADVCMLFNAWTKPLIPFKELPSDEVVVRSLFGDAWFDVVWGSRDDDPAALRRFLEAACPDLQPALLNDHIVGIDLPTIE